MQYEELIYRHRGILNPDDFSSHVTLRCYKPSEDLAPYIELLFVARWDLRGKADYVGEDVLTKPVVNLFFADGKAFFNGITPGRRSLKASGKGSYTGVKFKPGGFHAFGPHLFTNAAPASIPASDVFPKATPGFSKALLDLADDQAVVAKIETLLRTKHPKPDLKIVLINEIMKAIDAGPQTCTVAALAKQFAISERNLQRLFQEYVGTGIKWSVVRARLLAAFDEAHETVKPNWTNIAAELGYSSQSHLVNDFKKIIGVSPSHYFKSKETGGANIIEHSFSASDLTSGILQT